MNSTELGASITEAHAKQIKLFEGKRAVGVEFWEGDELR